MTLLKVFIIVKLKNVHLVGEELQEGRVVVLPVSDVLLGPQEVLHHQTEEEDKSKEMGPDVDSFVVELEDALDTTIIAQTRSVAGFYRNLFGKVRDLLYAEQLGC